LLTELIRMIRATISLQILPFRKVAHGMLPIAMVMV
jgi:hypothetical protein